LTSNDFTGNRIVDLSSAEARRLALSSLGFGAKKPCRAGAAHVRATAESTPPPFILVATLSWSLADSFVRST